MTVAGSDSGGGAGIQADLKTFQALGVFGMSAITAVTAQNSLGVQAVYALPREAVRAQLDAVLGDIGAHALKTGMLCSPDIVETVAEVIADYGIRHVVVDPVLHAKDGSALLRREALSSMRGTLLPLAEVVTPNIPEACELLGLPEDSIRTMGDMIRAARELLQFGSRWVLLKGGHLLEETESGTGLSPQSTDILVGASDPAAEPILLQADRLITRHTHGTGCTTASAIAAGLALGLTPPEAARKAKRYVTAAIAASVPLGGGIGSLWHNVSVE
ncbi:bifunctional hydroxymethylpyrimidine kinase/phosphomethylpyrimidine kinase [Paenibacillus humicola]|uniref:bifunctional hydroxymethylpyrimidine kinase/phosphomethylpyrimidine kinase n=1 Tax=Paenibacillus humicola TaxID=3110540 RepID=UPI00237AD304|nr:bifunctional hydroxymethylpyrimidine kinase/phosphomethylpyrimidine kinase [Paenibacillus humicola]